MSDEKVEKAIEEKAKKIVLSPDDCKSAMDFWTHFDIPLPPRLKAALDNFSKEQSLSNQDELKYELCRAIVTTEHDVFKDEMFNKIVEECKGVVYDMQFDRDLETTLTEDEKNKK